MPKKQILEGIIIIILLGFICMYIYDNYKVENKINILVENKSNCTKELTEYYTDSEGNTYFLYCIDNVIIDYSDRTLELNKALEAKQIKKDFLFENTSKNNNLSNETINYYENENFSLIECKRSDNKYNYIIGNSNMKYNEGLCNDTPYTYVFQKEYYIMDITNSKNSDYIYVTLKDEVLEEVSTIKLDNKYANSLKEDSIYIFEFASSKEEEDNIDNNFENNILLSINAKKIEIEGLENGE